MLIQVGYELVFNCPQATPMILMVNVHYSRASDIVVPDCLTTDPETPITAYRDGFGNWCSRIVAPIGRIRLKSTGVVRDSGETDVVTPSAQQHSLQDLPEDTLVFLLGSRYCETDLLSGRRGRDSVRPRRDGRGSRRSAILSTTISRSTISKRAPREPLGRRSTRVWASVATIAHLAIALCRCMNIPARYCTGYLGRHGDAAALRPDGLCSLD